MILQKSFSFDRCKPGQVLRGKIAKDVPLRNGSVIRKGSQVEGHIVEVTPASNGSGANVAMQFDKLDVGGRKVPVVTNLRQLRIIHPRCGPLTLTRAGTMASAIC